MVELAMAIRHPPAAPAVVYVCPDSDVQWQVLSRAALSPDMLIIQTIMDLIESDWAEMSHGQLKFVEIWRDRCCDNN